MGTTLRMDWTEKLNKLYIRSIPTYIQPGKLSKATKMVTNDKSTYTLADVNSYLRVYQHIIHK